MFGRVARLQIGNVELEGLAVKFNVRRVPGKLDSAQIDVLGLSRDSFGLLGTPGTVSRLIAGYLDAVGTIVEGTTVPESLRRPVQDGEVITSWQVRESGSRLASVRLSASWPGSVSAETVIAYVALQLGVAVAPVTLPKSPTYARGYVVTGTAGDVLTALANDCGCRWSIHIGRLVLTPISAGSGRVRVVRLDAKAGLVGWPETSDGGRVRATALLQPGIMPGDRVQIGGRTLPGDYVVEQVEHRGDSWDRDWYSTLLLRAA